MQDSSKNYPSHLTLRMCPEEWEILDQSAGNMSYSAYMRFRVFGDAARERETKGKPAAKDSKESNQALALLGKLTLTREFDGMGKAALAGTLHLTEEQFQVIAAACADIRTIKDHTLKQNKFRKIYK